MKPLYVVLAMFLLSVTVHAQLFSADDVFTNIIESNAGISDGYAIFQMKNPYLVPIAINTDKISHDMIEVGSSTPTTSVKYFFLTKINVSEDDVSCSIQRNGSFGNSSDKFDNVCSKVTKTHEEEQFIPLTKTDLVFQPGQTKTLKVVVTYSAKLGNNARDWIPTLTIASNVYRQGKWVWFNQSWQNRVEINISQYRENDTVYANLSFLNITCSNVNCTDAVVVDQNDKELKFSDGRLAWQILLDNVTSRNYPENNMLVFVPQNNSLKYYIYYNNPAINQVGGSIILWQDNFERDAVGTLPMRMTSSSATTGQVCSTNGQKGVGCNTTGGNFVAFNVTQYRNVTVLWEINSSSNLTNSIIVHLFGNNSYRMPQTTGDGNFSINFQGSTIIGNPVYYNGSATIGYNITSQRDGNNLNFWINHTLKGGNASDTTRLTHSEIAFQPAIENKALLSLTVWNFSATTYKNATTIQSSSIQTLNIFINFTSPVSSTTINNTVDLIFKVQGNNSAYSCWKQLDSTETSLGSVGNNTLFRQTVTTSHGSHNLTVICQNNNQNTSESVVFTTLHYNLSLQFPSDVLETETTTFNVTIYTISNISNVQSVVLNYNGSLNTALRTSAVSNVYGYRNTLDIPIIVSNASSEVKSFFYNISFAYLNGSTLNVASSSSQHTVYRLNITNCTGSGQTINFSMWNEKTPTLSVVGDLRISFDLWLGDGSSIRQYGFNSSNLTTHAFCLFPQNRTLNANIRAEYESPTFSIRSFYIDNEELSNSTQHVDLYLLNNLSSTLVTLVAKEQSGIILSNAIIKAQKFYHSENLFRLVAMGRTNQEGKAFVNLEIPYPSYKFLVEQNNQLLITTQSQQIDSNGLIITINQQIPNVYNVYDKILSTCIANTTSKVISCTYSDSSGASGIYNLTVSRAGATLFTQICSQELTASSGTLICDISSQTNGTYFYGFDARYDDGSKIPLLSGSIRIGYVQRFGESGYFLAFILFLTLFFIGIDNPYTSMLLGVIGLVASSILELQPVQFASLSAMFFLVVIAMWKSSSKGGG